VSTWPSIRDIAVSRQALRVFGPWIARSAQQLYTLSASADPVGLPTGPTLSVWPGPNAGGRTAGVEEHGSLTFGVVPSLFTSGEPGEIMVACAARSSSWVLAQLGWR
jgi:hypothetical protein